MAQPAPRKPCPSCRFRLSPLALECPVCGLPVARPQPTKPLLFQASRLAGNHDPSAPTPTRAIDSPALGRIAPIQVDVTGEEAEAVYLPPEEDEAEIPDPAPAQAPSGPVAASFWPLAKLEFSESLLLLAVNLVLMGAATLASGVKMGRLYGELWIFLAFLHGAVSWALFLVPLTLAGISPFMSRFGMILDADLPERRLAFSLFHLLSVTLWPLSFAVMVLSRGHRSLAELITGQEIMIRPRG